MKTKDQEAFKKKLEDETKQYREDIQSMSLEIKKLKDEYWKAREEKIQKNIEKNQCGQQINAKCQSIREMQIEITKLEKELKESTN